MMSVSGPKQGDGWDRFLEDGDDVWWDAFETTEVGGNTVVDVDAYDEFDNLQELVNFVAGTGTYEDRNSFDPGEDDLQRQKEEMRRLFSPVCPDCEQELQDYLMEGAEMGEIDKDFYMDTQHHVTEGQSFRDEYDVKKVGTFVAYCEEHPETHFQYQESWYPDD